MSSYNRVILMGNLTRDPELRSTPNSTVVNLGLAVNRQYKVDGEKREETTFVDCEAWGGQADTIAKYMTKGRPILIEGRLRLDQWEDAEGGKRSKLKVVVDNFQFVNGGNNEDKKQPVGAGASAVTAPIEENDIPF